MPSYLITKHIKAPREHEKFISTLLSFVLATSKVHSSGSLDLLISLVYTTGKSTLCVGETLGTPKVEDDSHLLHGKAIVLHLVVA